ncbi:serine protease inhibitor 77Ba-like [Cydia pomonella]|uniref:serine protease inhibitor 77Ba-like n=1 Tax=Cydia pomonella TaxID=82600 RepID=UPI002ADE53A8|nr:serine protease inhibitor 77Ba-like [Cydia pomonella]
MILFVLELCACFVLCLGQNHGVKEPVYRMNLAKFSESTGNFTIELLYHVAKRQPDQNFVVSPFAAWTMLAVTYEGAVGNTNEELLSALRFPRKSPRTTVRYYYQEIAQWLVVNRTTAQFTKFSGIFMDRVWTGMHIDFRQIAEEIYNTEAVDLPFKNKAAAATINRAVSLTTEDRIPTLIDESHLNNTQLIIASAVYFNGQWTAPFNVITVKRDFYNSIGEKIGEVNMMYNRYTYPFANISELQASVIELPYGVENHMSMILILPNPGMTLKDMFLNFLKANLKTVFQELKVSQKDRGDVEIDCFIPRFKIVSNIELNEILKNGMRIHDLFDPKNVFLPRMSRWPIRGTRVIHKTEIDVTEESSTPSGNIAPEFANDSKVLIFEANRPFSYFIVEKHTDTVILAGVYRKPILY